jgi:hypothetical protein
MLGFVINAKKKNRKTKAAKNGANQHIDVLD